jgi:DNA-binding beta-propeller fold protein YncE
LENLEAWDLPHGERFTVLARFASHYALHGGPKFSPDGRFVYFASRDGWVSQYDLYSLQKVAEIRVGLNTRNVAASADGRWLLAGNTLPENLVLLDARTLQPVKTLPVRTQQGQLSRVSAVYDAAPRQSFIVALKDAPELWEISYNPAAEPIYDGYVHDYAMGEGLAKPGFLNPRRTPLDAVLDDFFFDPDYRHVIGASRDGRAQVVNLDIRRQVAALQLDGMPHLGAGITFKRDGRTLLATPNLKTGQVSVIDTGNWQEVTRIATPGPGFFLRSHERTPYAWVDAMMSAQRDTLTLIDKRTLQVAHTLRPRPGKTTAHVEFTRDGRYALVSVMETPGELLVIDAATLREVAALPMMKPIGKYNVHNKVTRSEGTSH